MNETNDGQRSHHGIKRRLTGAVLVPSAALIVLWLLASSMPIYNGLQLRATGDGLQETSSSGVDFLAGAQRERALSLQFLSRPDLERTELDRQRERTDRSLAKLREAGDPLLAPSPAEVRDHVRRLDATIDGLPALRSRIDSRQAGGGQVYGHYNDLVDAGTRLFESQARAIPELASERSGLLATQFLTASEQLSRSASLISGGMSTGEFAPNTHSEYAQLVGAYRSDISAAAEAAPPHVRGQHRELTGSPAWERLLAWEQLLISEGEWAVDPQLPFTEQEWQATTRQLTDALTELAESQSEHAANIALREGNNELAVSIIGSSIALAAILVAIWVAVRVVRRISNRLTALQRESLELAGSRLPALVERLRRGEPVAVETEVDWLHHGDDEIGQVADAFNTTQRTAITAAAKEANAKDGANRVFLGIAHRSQELMHRQLRLLDELERHEAAPARMEMLFQLDHLATRARRNAENLIILGGQHPGRRWSKPVDLTDIVGGAIAETKHYTRVRTERITGAALTGSAVADTVHLVAELIDNATAFSPPHSQVTVLTRTVAKGVAIEVEDHGLGMDEHALEAANTMLSDPPEFDAMALREDTRLGLFVVARLAVKHGIGVELRPSAYGGTRAVVLLPSELTAHAPEPDADRDTAEIPTARTETPPGPQIAGTTPAEVPKPAAGTEPDADAEPEWPPEPEPAEAPCWPTSEPPQQGPPPLPRRRKRANLAPQLRAEATTVGTDAAEELPGRSADEIRRLMSAVQRASNEARTAGSAAERGRTDSATNSEG